MLTAFASHRLLLQRYYSQANQRTLFTVRTMTSTTFTPDFPPNPGYGNGIFRRRIRLTGKPQQVLAELEDCSHGFRSLVSHNGKAVIDIQTEALRTPLNTCGGASEPIKALIGLPLNTATTDILRQVDPRANCTHLYDLTLLAIKHCLRGEVSRQYDVTVTDETKAPAEAEVRQDGKLVLHWKTHQWAIVSPPELTGKPLHKGFASWANQHYSGEQQDAAFVLQKGYFVSSARVYDMDKLAGTPALKDANMQGVCYSYSPQIIAQAYRQSKSNRDFTDIPEQLLKFL